MSDKPKLSMRVHESLEAIGHPEQCSKCFAWVLPGQLHTCSELVDMRPLWLAAFGLALRQRRDALGLTQEAVAMACGMSRASIANMEAGRQEPTLTRVYALAAALRCTPGEIV